MAAPAARSRYFLGLMPGARLFQAMTAPTTRPTNPATSKKPTITPNHDVSTSIPPPFGYIPMYFAYSERASFSSRVPRTMARPS